MASQTEQHQRRFPDFRDLESVKCIGDFTLERYEDNLGDECYLMDWRYRQRKFFDTYFPDLISPEPPEVVGDSPFERLDRRLAVFGLGDLGLTHFITGAAKDDLVRLSCDLGGWNDTCDGFHPVRTGFTTRLEAWEAAEIYEAITQSPAGQKLKPECWKFKWHNVLDSCGNFGIYERPRHSWDFEMLELTNRRVREIAQEMTGGLLNIEAFSELHLCHSSAEEKAYIVLSSGPDKIGLSLPLDMDRYGIVWKYLQ